MSVQMFHVRTVPISQMFWEHPGNRYSTNIRHSVPDVRTVPISQMFTPRRRGRRRGSDEQV